jgi:hypothetical protein
LSLGLDSHVATHVRDRCVYIGFIVFLIGIMLIAGSGFGESIPLPTDFSTQNSSGAPVKLIRTTDPPLISHREAMEVVAEQFPWGLGGEYEGKPISVQGWYGIGTIGSPGPSGWWAGDRNIPLPDGEMLDHIENRSMWILAYANVPGIMGSQALYGPPPPVYHHNVYAVDARTRSIIWFASY